MKDKKKMPAIATKLSVNTNLTTVGRVSPSSVSPLQSGTTLCVKCKQYQGVPEHNGMCSSCYKSQQSTTELCPGCKDMYGTVERKGYCSKCYNQLLSLDESGSSKDSSARGTSMGYIQKVSFNSSLAFAILKLDILNNVNYNGLNNVPAIFNIAVRSISVIYC